MGTKRDLCLLLMVVFFFANTLVMLFCHHIATEHSVARTSSMLSSFLESGSGSMYHKNDDDADDADADDDLPVFAICVLTRDDLPILPEWIAYHYHAINLRHLVIAVDADSKSDPKPILENFRNHLGNNGVGGSNNKNRVRGSNNNNNNNKNNNMKKNASPLIIDQWYDSDFMPDYFVKGDFGSSPNFVGGIGGPDDTQTWKEWYSKQKNFFPKKISDQTKVNSHRFRQTRFLSRCSEHLRDIYKENNNNSNNSNNKTIWMSTLDTDEYLAVNPWVLRETPSVDESIKRLQPGAVLRWLVDSKAQTKQKQQQQKQQQQQQQNHASPAAAAAAAATTVKSSTNEGGVNGDFDGDICLQVPRLLFGALELSSNSTTPERLDSDVTYGWVGETIRTGDSDGGEKEHRTTNNNNNNNNAETEAELMNIEFVSDLPRHSNKMETLRWKFHAAPDDERNFQQKVILDLLKVPEDDEIWGNHVFTVHRPSRKLCSPESENNSDGTLLVPTTSKVIKTTVRDASPVVAFHYIGSEERYFSRPDDFRRNKKRYRERSNITHSRDETGWIDQWLERFVTDVGIETASALLSTYAVNTQEITK
jgi:hypothetical protein